MRYIDNFELREWVKDNLRKTIFQKAHALSIQTGCEVLIKLKDDADELAGQQCYATGSLQKDYINKGLRKHPEEFFVSGETGLPLVDQGIQSDETSLPPKTSSRTNSASSTHQQAGHDDLESFTQLRGPLGKGGTRSVSEQSFQTDVLTASSQHSDTEMKMRAVSLSQNTEFHSTIETEGYGPSCAMDQSMQEEDDGGGGSGDDDIRTLVKMEPGIDLDHIPAALSSSDTPAGVISKTEHISGNIDVDAEDAQDMDDADLTSMSLTDAALSQELDGSGAGMLSDLHVTPSQDTTNKPFQCAICQKAFRSVQVLQKHSVTFHRQGQQGKAIRLAAPRSRSRGGGKHSGGMQSRTNTQTFMHTCTICNQRFPESILLNDHIVKTHLNVSQMIPSAQNAPGPSQLQYANTQGSPQLPQITSVSSLQYQPPMNPIPSAASSYGQSPVAPKPSTSQQGQISKNNVVQFASQHQEIHQGLSGGDTGWHIKEEPINSDNDAVDSDAEGTAISIQDRDEETMTTTEEEVCLEQLLSHTNPAASNELVDILKDIKTAQSHISSTVGHMNDSLGDLSTVLGTLQATVDDNLNKTELVREALKLVNQQPRMAQSSTQHAQDIPSTSGVVQQADHRGISTGTSYRQKIDGHKTIASLLGAPNPDLSIPISGVSFTPRCMDGPTPYSFYMGGVKDYVRPKAVYYECMKEIQVYKKTNLTNTKPEDFGRLLCLAIIRKEFSADDLGTKNVTGVSKTSDKRRRIDLEKLDQRRLKAIFDQASMQFPEFVDQVTDTASKTVIAIQDLCKRFRRTYQTSKKLP